MSVYIPLLAGVSRSWRFCFLAGGHMRRILAKSFLLGYGVQLALYTCESIGHFRETRKHKEY